MFSAIHKKTGIPYLGPQIWKPGLFENKDVHKEKWLCPQEEIENIDEINEEIFVTPVMEHSRKDIFIPAFFRLYPKYSDKVILKPESEKHKKAKTVLCSLLTEDKDFQLIYDNDIYSANELPIDYEKLRNNIRKIEVTKYNTFTNQKKRADVLIPFIFNAYFGNGIVIEIKISEKDEKTEEKEDFWFQRGYSIIWVEEIDFEQIDGRWGLKRNQLQVTPFSVGYNKIVNGREEELRSYLHRGFELLDEIEDKINEEYKKKRIELTENINQMRLEAIDVWSKINNAVAKTCRTCKYGSIAKKKDGSENGGLIVCWYDTKLRNGHNTKPTNHEPLDGCDNHELR